MKEWILPVLKLERGVSLRGLKPEMTVGVVVVALQFISAGVDCVVTAGTNGEHMPGSLHYAGQAADFRTRHITSRDDLNKLVTRIRKALGPEYDVVVHDTHLHIEYQPKRPMP